MFAPYIERWGLVADGAPIATRANQLLPVRYRGEAAMLKLIGDEDELRGAKLMQWWDGDGAGRVLAQHGNALLLERAEGAQSLTDMARSGRDDEATLVLCATALQLHRTRSGTPPELVPLDLWFRDLWSAADMQRGLLSRAAEVARGLLGDQQEIVVLHGDLHHGNVLDFGPRGWLAIDPKGLVGDRAFEYAIIFANPDLEHPEPPVAVNPERFAQRLEIVTNTAQIERGRMLRWILAWAGLSATWFCGDGEDAEIDLRIAALAAEALDG